MQQEKKSLSVLYPTRVHLALERSADLPDLINLLGFDECQILIKRHLTMLQAFHRYGFQWFFGQFNVELFVGRINLQNHRPTVIGSPDIVFVLVDTNPW